jgi:hypothetical protein
LISVKSTFNNDMMTQTFSIEKNISKKKSFEQQEISSVGVFDIHKLKVIPSC